MNESLIEKESVKHGEKKGWLVKKAASPGSVGTHDRIFHGFGVTFYIEFKSTGKKATPMQRKFAEELTEVGIVCRCFDSLMKAKRFIDQITYFVMCIDKDLSGFIDISSFDP